jgi:hypothetical protein
MNNTALALLFAFLVAFPKAGFKVSEVPITIGYLLLGAIAVWAVLINLARGKYSKFPKRSLFAFALTLPLQVLTLLLVVALASADIAYSISFVTSFLALPLVFLIILTPQLLVINPDRFDIYLRRCVSFAAMYGIVLFVYLTITGSFIEIPFLTVNADDVGKLATEKHIDRGNGIFKLISTYNNGNIYGVCILMLLPIYDMVQRSFFWRLLVRFSLVLTLSRTVWFGMVAYELIAALYLRPFRLNTVFYVLLSLTVSVGAVLYVLSALNLDPAFLFDPNLGGRAAAVQSTQLYFIPQDKIGFPSEIIYINVLNALGTIGLVYFMIAMLAPIVLAFEKARRTRGHVRSFVVGMLMLLICGLSDGPILLIPVMVFYWVLAALSVSDMSWNDSLISVC